jgi:hypothetical protein
MLSVIGCSTITVAKSVLLLHIVVDLCFYQKCSLSVSYEIATGCREIFNYIIHLLVVNPEILLSGTRRNLFLIANAQLVKILEDDKLLLKKIIQGNSPSFMEILKCNEPFLQNLKGKTPSLQEIKRELTDRIISKLQVT